MDKTTAKKRTYYSACSVFGCLNTTMNSVYAFFTFPNDIERRNLWLSLIDREDVKNKWSTHLRVCEVHFETGCFLRSECRTILKKGSVPKLLLPKKTNESKQTQASVETAEAGSQCEKLQQRDFSSQTPAYLAKIKIPGCKERVKKESDRKMFYRLCDKFLNQNFSNVAKEQAKFKLKSHGNRYRTEYKTFCLKMFRTSPKAYDLLRETLLNMPSKTTLKRMCRTPKPELNTVTEGADLQVSSPDACADFSINCTSRPSDECKSEDNHNESDFVKIKEERSPSPVENKLSAI